MKFKKGLIVGFFAGIIRVILNLLKYKLFKSYYILPALYSPRLNGDPTQWLLQTALTDLIVGILFGLLFVLLINALPGTKIKRGLGYGFVMWVISELPSLLTAYTTRMIDLGLITLWGIAGLISSFVIGMGIVFIYDLMLKQEVKGGKE